MQLRVGSKDASFFQGTYIIPEKTYGDGTYSTRTHRYGIPEGIPKMSVPFLREEESVARSTRQKQKPQIIIVWLCMYSISDQLMEARGRGDRDVGVNLKLCRCVAVKLDSL
jgi:hypothetical protein